MQAKQVLPKLLQKVDSQRHKLRRTALAVNVMAARHGEVLTVTQLGRSITSRAKEKHGIKRADRLLSNRRLQAERLGIYSSRTRWLIGAKRRPVIRVDWSDLDEWKRHLLLSASVPLRGRSLTLYEAGHHAKSQAKAASLSTALAKPHSPLTAANKPRHNASLGCWAPPCRGASSRQTRWSNSMPKGVQIEEAFRDLKSTRFGLSLELHRTYQVERLQVLLLIATLALMVAWLIGKATELTGQHRHYQANTVRDRVVLSTIFVGLKVIDDPRVTLRVADLFAATKSLDEIIQSHGLSG